MRHWLLTYTLAADYMERRPEFRPEHLAMASEATARGDLLLGGAALEADGAVSEALLLFAGDDAGVAEAFAEADPYVREGLVVGWRVREWVVVAGSWAPKA
ncbi:MAG: YciI-like protein [Novosphingobium sp.]